MKTSNKILMVYGVLLGLFTFASLGLNAAKYRREKPQVMVALESMNDWAARAAAAEAQGIPTSAVLVVDADTRVYLTKEMDHVTLNSNGVTTPEVSVSGDTLRINGAGGYLWVPPVDRVIKGGETKEVPPVETWQSWQLDY